MAYGDFKDLTRGTASVKILHDKAISIAKNPKYDGYQSGQQIHYNILDFQSWSINFLIHKGINMQVFFGKSVEKKHLCRNDKNCYYFFKSNIPVINLIEDSRNIIKLLKKMSL